MKINITFALLLAGIAGISAQAAPNAKTNASAKTEATTSTAAKPANASKPDEVIAKGKGVEVKRSELDEAMASVQKGMAAQGREISRDQMEGVEPELLDRLIELDLFTSQATEEDKKAAKETTAKRIGEIKAQAGSLEAIEARLKTLGLTMQEFEAKMGEEALGEAVLARQLKVNVTDAEAKKFYDENPAQFERPEMVRASHILLMTRDEIGKDLAEDKKQEKRKKIEELLKKARAGEDFAKLAKENSEDPGSKDKGGEYTFPRGQMVPEFEQAAFALNTNGVSDVVTTQFGYHIIKLHEKFPAKKVSYEEIAPKIKEALQARSMQAGKPELAQKLRKEAGVKILDERLTPKAKTNTPAALPGQSAPKKDAAARK